MQNDFNKQLQHIEKQLKSFVLDNKQANELYETIEKLKNRIAQRNRIDDWDKEVITVENVDPNEIEIDKDSIVFLNLKED